MTPWERSLASVTHALLYVLIFLQPLSGYLSSSFSGYTTSFFGLPLPHWGWKDPVLNDLFSELHEANALLRWWWPSRISRVRYGTRCGPAIGFSAVCCREASNDPCDD